MLVQTKTGADESVLERDSSVARVLGLWRPPLDVLPLLPYRKRRVMHWSVGWAPARIAHQIRALDPDLVHFHWICRGFVPLSSFGKTGKKVLWTLHDSWPFTGGCHVPEGCLKYEKECGACPLLGSRRESDLSRWTWKRKRRHFGKTELTVVTPSRWLAECASRSALFRERRIEVIPNGIDTDLYRPLEKKNARDVWKLPQEKKLILFGAMNAFTDRNKGFSLLAEALRHLAGKGWAERAEVVVFGAQEPSPPPGIGLQARYLGVLGDDVSMALLYSAADVVVVPSLQENFPNVVLEAMACGTPVVAFRVGGIPDMITHGLDGFLADSLEPGALAGGIERVLSEDARLEEMSRRAHECVRDRFNIHATSARYRDLYAELLHGGA
jgi:glycosyltransferase involved in cell wall biosynthesis